MRALRLPSGGLDTLLLGGGGSWDHKECGRLRPAEGDAATPVTAPRSGPSCLTYLPTYLPGYLPTYYLLTYYLHTYPPTYLPTHLVPTYLPTYLCFALGATDE